MCIHEIYTYTIAMHNFKLCICTYMKVFHIRKICAYMEVTHLQKIWVAYARHSYMCMSSIYAQLLYMRISSVCALLQYRHKRYAHMEVVIYVYMEDMCIYKSWTCTRDTYIGYMCVLIYVQIFYMHISSIYVKLLYMFFFFVCTYFFIYAHIQNIWVYMKDMLLFSCTYFFYMHIYKMYGYIWKIRIYIGYTHMKV